MIIYYTAKLYILNTKAETTIIESDTDDILESIYSTITSKIQKSLGQGSGWIIDSAIDHNINISKYNPLAGGSNIRLLKDLDHPRKGLLLTILVLINALALNGF